MTKLVHGVVHGKTMELDEDLGIPEGQSVAAHRLYENGGSDSDRVQVHPALHLPVAVRSFRASAVADWVNAVVAGRAEEARNAAADCDQFPDRPDSFAR